MDKDVFKTLPCSYVEIDLWGLKLSQFFCPLNVQTVKAFLPSMLEKNRGHIVSTASAAGLFGVAGLCDYCASKFAAVGFMESLR